jgi:hypothetical protein
LYGRPPEWWALTAHHGSPARNIIFYSENVDSHSYLTWASSACWYTPPPIHQNRAKHNCWTSDKVNSDHVRSTFFLLLLFLLSSWIIHVCIWFFNFQIFYFLLEHNIYTYDGDPTNNLVKWKRNMSHHHRFHNNEMPSKSLCFCHYIVTTTISFLQINHVNSIFSKEIISLMWIFIQMISICFMEFFFLVLLYFEILLPLLKTHELVTEFRERT